MFSVTINSVWHIAHTETLPRASAAGQFGRIRDINCLQFLVFECPSVSVDKVLPMKWKLLGILDDQRGFHGHCLATLRAYPEGSPFVAFDPDTLPFTFPIMSSNDLKDGELLMAGMLMVCRGGLGRGRALISANLLVMASPTLDRAVVVTCPA